MYCKRDRGHREKVYETLNAYYQRVSVPFRLRRRAEGRRFSVGSRWYIIGGKNKTLSSSRTEESAAKKRSFADG